MKEFSTLAELLPGERGKIGSVLMVDTLPRRLLDLGFTHGSKVECLFCSAAGDPRAYLVRGTVIALRQEDAAKIMVEKEAEG